MTTQTQLKFLYYLKTTLASGREAWFVVKAFDSVKLAILEGLIKQNAPYNIRDYAEILHAGYEPTAPQEVLDHVNSVYGTEFSN